MLMPIDFVKIYNDHLIPFGTEPACDFQETYYDNMIDFPKGNDDLRELFETPELITKEQWAPYWERIVEVFSVIKTNPHNFNMEMWHCDTSHCIAGWAQVIYTKKIDSESCSYVAEDYLSPLMRPFFHCVEHMLAEDTREVITTAEDAIMQYLIDPVLAEARKDGTIPVVTQVLQSA